MAFQIIRAKPVYTLSELEEPMIISGDVGDELLVRMYVVAGSTTEFDIRQHYVYALRYPPIKIAGEFKIYPSDFTNYWLINAYKAPIVVPLNYTTTPATFATGEIYNSKYSAISTGLTQWFFTLGSNDALLSCPNASPSVSTVALYVFAVVNSSVYASGLDSQYASEAYNYMSSTTGLIPASEVNQIGAKTTSIDAFAAKRLAASDDINSNEVANTLVYGYEFSTSIMNDAGVNVPYFVCPFPSNMPYLPTYIGNDIDFGGHMLTYNSVTFNNGVKWYIPTPCNADIYVTTKASPSVPTYFERDLFEGDIYGTHLKERCVVRTIPSVPRPFFLFWVNGLGQLKMWAFNVLKMSVKRKVKVDNFEHLHKGAGWHPDTRLPDVNTGRYEIPISMPPTNRVDTFGWNAADTNPQRFTHAANRLGSRFYSPPATVGTMTATTTYTVSVENLNNDTMNYIRDMSGASIFFTYDMDMDAYEALKTDDKLPPLYAFAQCNIEKFPNWLDFTDFRDGETEPCFDILNTIAEDTTIEIEVPERYTDTKLT